jgi:hypothetical protein
MWAPRRILIDSHLLPLHEEQLSGKSSNTARQLRNESNRNFSMKGTDAAASVQDLTYSGVTIES